MTFDKAERAPIVHALFFYPLTICMMSHLVDEASKKISSVPHLVNVVSKRVRQLNAGHKPMVDVVGRMGLADIALTEIIQGKLSFELKPRDPEVAA